MSRLVLAYVAIAVLGNLSPATAAAKDHEIAFAYDPAETANSEDVAKLYDRLVSFAKAQCSTISSPRIVNPRAEKCAKDLVEQFVAQVNAPLLASHAKRAVNITSLQR